MVLGHIHKKSMGGSARSSLDGNGNDTDEDECGFFGCRSKYYAA
jgi:hypothetical protein